MPLLEFGAASIVADVWLNDQKLGQHRGAFTAFRFDVTDQLADNGPNVLYVKVNNSQPENDHDVTAIIPLGGDFNMYGGLYRYVALISTPAPVYIDLSDYGASGVYATTTSIDNGNATVRVRDEPVVHIVGHRYTNRAYPVADVKVYSNADAVRLSVNGAEVGTMTQDDALMCTYVFENVRLSPGANRLEAVGDYAGEPVRDSVEWELNHRDVNIAAGQLTTGFTSSAGDRFGSDHFFTGGEGVWLIPRKTAGVADRTPVRGTEDPDLYKTVRQGQFSYYVPLDNGDYEVTLGFLEPWSTTGEGNRIFDVIANGEPKIEELDVLREAGRYRTAITRTFGARVSDGFLKLDFRPRRGDAVVSNLMIRGRRAPDVT